jgi:hypothetical protein
MPHLFNFFVVWDPAQKVFVLDAHTLGTLGLKIVNVWMCWIQSWWAKELQPGVDIEPLLSGAYLWYYSDLLSSRILYCPLHNLPVISAAHNYHNLVYILFEVGFHRPFQWVITWWLQRPDASQELQSATSTAMIFHQSKMYSAFPFILPGPWCAQDKQKFWSPTTEDVHNSDGVESTTSNCTSDIELRSSLASSFELESQELPSTPEASSSSANLSTYLLQVTSCEPFGSYSVWWSFSHRHSWSGGGQMAQMWWLASHWRKLLKPFLYLQEPSFLWIFALRI